MEVKLIPSYPGSKSLVPSEQIFGKPKPIVNPAKMNTRNVSATSNFSPGHFGKTPMFTSPLKPNANVRKQQAGVNHPPSKSGDKWKRPLDNEGFTLVTHKKNTSKNKGKFPFASGYTGLNINSFNVLQSLENPSMQGNEGVNLEVVMNELDTSETVPLTPLS